MYTLENFYRVYDDKTGFYWEIRPDSDGLGLVEIAYYEENRVFKKDIIMPPAVAFLVAEAVMKVANSLFVEGQK
jgi:hypothetical protein